MESAAEQSKQLKIPELSPPFHLSDLSKHVRASDYDLKLICWESEITTSIKQALHVFKQAKEGQEEKRLQVAILIGPESGLTKHEVGQCQDQEFVSVSLGPTVLRVEHAAFFACAQVLYEFSRPGQ